MTTHTPGPWRVNSVGPARFIYDSTPEGWAVADVKTFHGRHPEGQSEANARLIAAAPLLLAALKMVAPCWPLDGIPKGGEHLPYAVTARAIHEAIAKAEASS